MIENILKIQNILKRNKLKLWLMINREDRDKVFCKYISNEVLTLSFCFISLKTTYILIQDLDRDNLDKDYLKDNNINVISYKSKKDLDEKLEYVLAKLGFIDNISLSYSNLGDVNTDILGHGEFLKYEEMLKKIYSKYNKKFKVTSAENVIYELLSSKSEEEISKMKKVTNITNEMIDEFFTKMKVGMTELNIYETIRNTTLDMSKKYINSEIIDINFAWNVCPIVLIGENLTKGAHSKPSNKVLNYGNTIYIDFGLEVIFNTGEKIYSDMQRMGYALDKNENKVPDKILKIFNTLVNSINESLKYMKPGVYGYEIDKMVRDKIVNAGYPNYDHASGHPCFYNVHDIGTVITTKNKHNLKLAENVIYTLEPRIAVENGGSIEEMILVTKSGGIPISRFQKELYII